MKNKISNFAAVLIIVLLIAAYPMAYMLSKEHIEVTIKDKDRITTGSGEDIKSKYIIYTESEVFENTDALLFWKFNSSDLQNNLTIGKTYKVTVAGWRIPFMSTYRNIIEK